MIPRLRSSSASGGPQRDDPEHLGGRRAAERGVVAHLRHGGHQVAVARRQPADAQAGQGIGLREHAHADGARRAVGRGGQPRRGIVLEPSVDLVADERGAVAIDQLHQRVELRPAHVHARRVVREVDDHGARLGPHGRGDAVEVECPAVLGPQLDQLDLRALRPRQVVERLVGRPERDDVIARPDERGHEQEERLARADHRDHVVGLERLVEARRSRGAGAASRASRCSRARGRPRAAASRRRRRRAARAATAARRPRRTAGTARRTRAPRSSARSRTAEVASRALAQLAAADLARDRLGQGVDELDLARVLVGRGDRLDVLLQLACERVGAPRARAPGRRMP